VVFNDDTVTKDDSGLFGLDKKELSYTLRKAIGAGYLHPRGKKKTRL
jgi:hypothetical protein